MTEKYGNILIAQAGLESEHLKQIPKPTTPYDPTPLTEKELYYLANSPYDVSGGIHSIMVYSNIIKPSFVGDSYTQLLRVIEIPKDAKYGDQVLLTFSNTYYIPLL